jgi:hypothetical protein
MKKAFNIIIILILILGVFLRVKFYLAGRPFWHDEELLVANIHDINRNFFGFFKPLSNNQLAPPLFVIMSKFFHTIIKVEEFALRFIPTVTGIIALPVFYFFSKIFLDKKWSVILATLLFVFNYQIIYYAQEFKPYSSDVLFIMIAVILAHKIDLNSVNKKQAFLYGIIAAIFPLVSLPTIFVIAAFLTNYFIFQLIKKQNNFAKFGLFLLSFGSIMLFYYLNTLLPAKHVMGEFMDVCWETGFLTLNYKQIIYLLQFNVSYYFSNHFAPVCIYMLLILGVSYFAIETINKEQKYENRYLLVLTILIFAILASVLRFYPMKGRVILYITPIIIVLICKPLDYILCKNKIYSIAVAASFLFFLRYYPSYLIHLFSRDMFHHQDGFAAMLFLKEKYKHDEVVVINEGSIPDYLSLSRILLFHPDNVIYIKGDPSLYNDNLDTLPKGKTYWFYYTCHYPKTFTDWSIKQEKLSYRIVDGTRLLHIKIK